MSIVPSIVMQLKEAKRIFRDARVRHEKKNHNGRNFTSVTLRFINHFYAVADLPYHLGNQK